MQVFKNYRIGILVLSLICCSFTINAAHYNIKEGNTQESSRILKQSNKTIKGFFKNIISTKKTTSNDDKIIKRASLLSIINGSIAVLFMLLTLVTGGSVLMAFAFILGVAGVISAIRALSRIGKAENREDYKTQKRRAKIGLWLSLGAMLFPFAVFIIWLIAVIIQG